MDSQISGLKLEFITIVNHRETSTRVFDVLEKRIAKLKSIYNDFITHNEKQLFIFGLDSFRFQSRLMDIEYDDMKRMFLAINNRFYCEYYKLYRMIVCYIMESVNEQTIVDKIIVDKFPVYRDLEPFKDYDFSIITEVHENILILLSSLVNKINIKERELVIHNKKLNIGLNIDNFISSFNYDINNTKEKICLFIKYMNFFHKSHIKMLQRFVDKLQDMYSNIDKDIDFDEEPEFIPCVLDTQCKKEESNILNIPDEKEHSTLSNNKKRKKKKK
jgi:hypothetical protein